MLQPLCSILGVSMAGHDPQPAHWPQLVWGNTGRPMSVELTRHLDSMHPEAATIILAVRTLKEAKKSQPPDGAPASANAPVDLNQHSGFIFCPDHLVQPRIASIVKPCSLPYSNIWSVGSLPMLYIGLP